MVGRRGRNLREGDLAEGIGLELFRTFAAVAPVPRTEDVGIDAICTLLKQDGPLLLADDAFLVQIKAASVRIIEYHGAAFNWLLQQKTPIYLASVNLQSASVNLYTMQRAIDRVDDLWQGVTVYLDTSSADDGEDYDHGPIVRDGIHHIYLGSPVLQWSTSEAWTDGFRSNAFTVMKAWIAWDETNITLRPYRCCNAAYWRTGDPPQLASRRLGTHVDTHLVRDFGDRFGAVMLALANECASDEKKLMLDVIELMKMKGIRATNINIAEAMLRSSLNQASPSS